MHLKRSIFWLLHLQNLKMGYSITHHSISPRPNYENNNFHAKFNFIHQHSLLLGWYTDSNASLTTWWLFCRIICLWPQNMPQFPILLCHWSQISFPGAFFWHLQTASSCQGPNLENRVNVEAIQSAIHIVLPLLWSTCDMVHCLGERALFSSSFVAIFRRFLPSNAPIMLYNNCYWWLLLSQGNRWTKYLAHPKIWRLKPCLLMFASLVTLDSFYLLMSTQLTVDLTLEWSGRSMFHPLSHIYAKTPFCCSESLIRCCFWSTVSKCGTHFEHSFLIDKCSCKIVNMLPSYIFNSFTISRNFNLRSSQNEFVEFFGVFWDNCQIWVTWVFSIICVYMTAFKVSIPPLNCCFQ